MKGNKRQARARQHGVRIMTRIQRWTIQRKADAVDRFLDEALAPLIVALTAIAFIYTLTVLV